MIEAWSAAQVREAEEPLLAAGVPLMERAAFALSRVVLDDLRARRHLCGGGSVRGAQVALLVGPGNNGGDALFAGAYLARRGVAVTACLVAGNAHQAGLSAFVKAGGRVVRDITRIAEAVTADVIVDGLLGIGATGPVRGNTCAVIEALLAALPEAPNPRRPWVVAVDAPSGIGVDDGAVAGPVLPADRTVTFGVAKPGLLLPPAAHLAGLVTIVDIGIPLGVSPLVRRLEPANVAACWVAPVPGDHKYTRGVVGVVAGTETYPGAAVLTVGAAARCGAGMVRYLGPSTVTSAVLAAQPEVVTVDGPVQAWVLGPGVPAFGDGLSGDEPSGDESQHRERARLALAIAAGWLRDPRLTARATTAAERSALLASPAAPGQGAVSQEALEARRRLAARGIGMVPVVVDAGALTLLERPVPPWVVLVPHAGELATLLATRGEQVAGRPVSRADIEAEPLRWTQRAHELTGATVLLKGAITVVVGPKGATFAQASAPAWAATAGSGDVLAGILGAMLAARAVEVVAQPELAAEVAAAAAELHGLAAARVNPGGPLTAGAIAAALPETIADLLV